MNQCHNISDGDPVFKLHQSGFLSWMNERGRQCINHITGVFHQVKADGNGGYTYDVPTSSTPGSTTHECWSECMVLSRDGSDNSSCITCIMNQLNHRPELCVGPISKELMTDVLDCQLALVPEMLDTTSELSYPQIWSILTTDKPHPRKLSTTLLVVIIVVTIITVILVAVAYNQLVYHRRLEALQKRNAS